MARKKKVEDVEVKQITDDKVKEITNKKESKKMKEEIISDFKESMKEDIVTRVADDIKASFNKDYKDAIKDDLTVEIKEDIIKQVRKEQKKISSQKSFKIFRLYLYILILICLILYLLYKLYMTDNLNIISSRLDKILNRTTTTSQVVVDTTTTTTKPLGWYIDKFGYLMDDIQITNYDFYKTGMNVDNMTNEDKLIMSYNLVNNVVQDEDIYTIDEASMKEAYEKIFKSLDNYKAVRFETNGLKYSYSKNSESYIAISSETPIKDEIIYEITDVQVTDDEVVIQAISAIKRGNEVYSAYDNLVSIAKYSSKFNLSNYRNALPTNKYVFKYINNEYVFSEIKVS